MDLNAATMAEKLVQVSGKTITATAQSITTLFGATIPGGNIVGWRLEGYDDQGAGAARGAILWGDSTAQKAYLPAGVPLDWGGCPVRDPAQIYVKRAGGSDVANCVLSVLHRIDGN